MSNVYQQIVELLGQDLHDPRCSRVFQELQLVPEIIEVPPTKLYDFNHHGFTLFSINNKFRFAVLRRWFVGTLPNGINFDDRSWDVQKKLALKPYQKTELSEKEYSESYDVLPNPLTFHFIAMTHFLRSVSVELPESVGKPHVSETMSLSEPE